MERNLGKYPTIIDREPKGTVVLERPIAVALGHGLNQILTSKSKSILEHIGNLSSVKEHADNAQIMHESLNFTLDLTDKLQTSKIVALTGRTLTQSDFEFSEEQEDVKMDHRSREFLLDMALSARIIFAINHNFYNKFTSLMGFSKLVEQVSADNLIRGTAGSIYKLADETLSGIPWYRNTHGHAQWGNKLKLHTDNWGNTRIHLIPPKEPSPLIY